MMRWWILPLFLVPTPIQAQETYLFYNPDPRGDLHHNVKELLATLPPDTISVPFGWTVEIETAREDLLKQLGVSGISALPSVLHFVPEHQVDDGEGGKITVPARWVEERVADTPKEKWTWSDIDAAIDASTPDIDPVEDPVDEEPIPVP
jgi:hypothetical protein